MLPFLKKKTKVIFDTNALFMPGELGIDIFTQIQELLEEPFELCVLDKTIKELEEIIKRGSQKKEAFNAKLGLILIKQKSLKTIPSSQEQYADEALLDYAKKDPAKTIIITQDKTLQELIKKVGARVISLRQKKYLTWGG